MTSPYGEACDSEQYSIFICDLINADEYMFRRSVYHRPGKPHPLRPQRACEGDMDAPGKSRGRWKQGIHAGCGAACVDELMKTEQA